MTLPRKETHDQTLLRIMAIYGNPKRGGFVDDCLILVSQCAETSFCFSFDLFSVPTIVSYKRTKLSA